MGEYRYAFNGMEKDGDIAYSNYTTEFRQYNPVIGRWMSIDPMNLVLPSESPYNFAMNMPIVGNDKDGDICVPCLIVKVGASAGADLGMQIALEYYFGEKPNNLYYVKFIKVFISYLPTIIETNL